MGVLDTPSQAKMDWRLPAMMQRFRSKGAVVDMTQPLWKAWGPSETVAAGLEAQHTVKRKKSILRAPSRCVGRLRDSYVVWMLSIAGKTNSNLAAVAGSAWPNGAVVHCRYPGRTRRVEMTDEEVACAGMVLSGRSATGGFKGNARPPPCAKKAVFPL